MSGFANDAGAWASGPRRMVATGCALAAACLLAALAGGVASAWASHGEPFGAGFGVADINDGPGVPEAPAFPGQKAWWAGTCDLADGSTGSGGVGGPVAGDRAHCIDHGVGYLCVACFSPPRSWQWPTGEEPDWRLAPVAQAGAHPDASASFWHTRFPDVITEPVFTSTAGDGDTKTVMVGLPPGFVGNPTAVPKCPSEDLRPVPTTCPPESQVGVATITIGIDGGSGAAALQTVYPVYNVEARDGKTAEFMLSPAGVSAQTNVPVVARPRTDGDFGVDAIAMNLPGGFPLLGQTVTLWGVPWSSAHDAYRTPAGYEGHNVAGGGSRVGMPEDGLPDPQGTAPVPYDPSWGPIRPFTANPTECSGDLLVTDLRLFSWQNPDAPVDTPAPADAVVDGCENVPFDAGIAVEPTVRSAGSPSGLDVELTVAQNNDPPAAVATDPDHVTGAPAFWRSTDGLATAHLKDTVVDLPEGMAVTPSGAHGLRACSTAQIGLTGSSPVRFSDAPVRCPAGSRIGTVSVDTPLLDEQLEGAVYVASQGDNPFGTLLALYVVVESDVRGLRVKLAGRVDPDPVSGRLRARFASNPQLPFSKFALHFKRGPHAPLVTPSGCGVHGTDYRLDAWSGHEVAGADPAVIDQRCVARGFSPTLSAGVDEPVAGAYSPFRMRLDRSGVNQRELGRVELRMPRGALADLTHVQVCGEGRLAAIAARSGRQTHGEPGCPLGSQVGTTTVGAGAGPDLYYPRLPGADVSGRVYLTGPHRGGAPSVPGARLADYGLAIEVPAVAGPFDLGTVLVRAAIFVDPSTGQLTVVSDRLPRILQGIPLDVRDVRVAIDRPRFTTTPTSCADKQVAAKVHAQGGATVDRARRFQVGKCGELAFKPRLAIRLAGRRQTKTGGHPAVRALVRQSGLGEAGIRRARVALPKSLALDPSNAQALCEFEDGIRPDIENHCPDGSIVGRARAVSPLLKQPLAGDVYFVKNIRIDPDTGNEIRTLPMIVTALRGEVAINLRGESSTTKAGKLVNTFANVPDAPISRFNLNIAGGRNGILTVTRTSRGTIDLCTARRQLARAGWRGQSRQRRAFRVQVRTPCPKTKPRRGKAKRRAAVKRRAALRRKAHHQ